MNFFFSHRTVPFPFCMYECWHLVIPIANFMVLLARCMSTSHSAHTQNLTFRNSLFFRLSLACSVYFFSHSEFLVFFWCHFIFLHKMNSMLLLYVIVHINSDDVFFMLFPFSFRLSTFMSKFFFSSFFLTISR